MAVRARANFSFSSLIITSFSLFSTLSHLPSVPAVRRPVCCPEPEWQEREGRLAAPVLCEGGPRVPVPASRAQRSHVSAGPEVMAVASLHFDGGHTRPCGLGPGGSPGFEPGGTGASSKGWAGCQSPPRHWVPGREPSVEHHPKTGIERRNPVS